MNYMYNVYANRSHFKSNDNIWIWNSHAVKSVEGLNIEMNIYQDVLLSRTFWLKGQNIIDLHVILFLLKLLV